MPEDEDPEVAAALAKLAGQDAAAAEDARAALEWIAGGQGLDVITQQRVQNFCWYDLPVKWLVDLDDKLQVVAIRATVGQAIADEGFRDSRTGEPPDEHDVRWAIHRTSNLCRALGLLAFDGDWPDRRYGFTGTGRATALEALRARATGPRTIPWPSPAPPGPRP